MCIKINDIEGEMDTMKYLMSMSLNSLIADIFDLEIDKINLLKLS